MQNEETGSGKPEQLVESVPKSGTARYVKSTGKLYRSGKTGKAARAISPRPYPVLTLQNSWRRGVGSAGAAGGYGRMWKAARRPDLRSVLRLRFPQPTTTTWKKPCFFLSPLENPAPSPPPGFSTAPTPPRRRRKKDRGKKRFLHSLASLPRSD